MLELVSLTPTEAKRRVKNYSLGMRQRLGIANALLGDPKILILDEPANGLDPAGIHWMRGLLRDYANRGGTVLLSSHLLHEIEVIADEIIVIGQGKIVAEGTKEQLLQTAGTFVKAGDPSALANALTAAGIASGPSGDGGLRTEADPTTVGRAAAAAGVALVELRPADGAGLEEMFLQLTSSTQREAVTPEGATS
jgi:ABC-2 type transport system ATP-binding protein